MVTRHGYKPECQGKHEQHNPMVLSNKGRAVWSIETYVVQSNCCSHQRAMADHASLNDHHFRKKSCHHCKNANMNFRQAWQARCSQGQIAVAQSSCVIDTSREELETFQRRLTLRQHPSLRLSIGVGPHARGMSQQQLTGHNLHHKANLGLDEVANLPNQHCTIIITLYFGTTLCRLWTGS